MSGTAPIVALGDSVTWGFPGGPVTSWVQRVADALQMEILNMGVNGDTLQDIRQRVAHVIAAGPSACIVMGGTNDVAMGRPVEAMAGDLAATVETLAEAGIRPLIGMPIPFLDDYPERELASFRHFINAFAGTRGVTVIPFERAFREEAGAGEPAAIIEEHFVDVTHPSLSGYAAMARLVVEGEYLSGLKEANGGG